MKFDVYICYAHSERKIVLELIELLKLRSIVAVDIVDELSAGSGDYAATVVETIRSSKYVVILISENSVRSQTVKKELEFAFSVAKNRNKILIPVTFLPDLSLGTRVFEYFLSEYMLVDGTKGVDHIADEIARIVAENYQENSLTKEFQEYLQEKKYDQATYPLCNLIRLRCSQLLRDRKAKNQNLDLIQICMYIEQLSNFYINPYEKFARQQADAKMVAVDAVEQVMQIHLAGQNDLIALSAELRLLYLTREIRRDCVNARTHGDVDDRLIDPFPIEEYAKKQEPIYVKWNLESQKTGKEIETIYSIFEARFIKQTSKYCYALNGEANEQSVRFRKTSFKENEELFESVADFMKKGNEVLDLIGQGIEAREFCACLLTSYERLLKYCDIVGTKKIAKECKNRIEQLKQENSKNSKLARVNDTQREKAENGIRALLGLTISDQTNYDVFISYKHEDSDLADDLYYFIEKNLCVAFYDKKVLPELSKSDYEDAIMDALDKSRNFVLVMSDLKYLDSSWVRREIKTFNAEIQEGRKKDGNLIIVVTEPVYKEIISTNKQCLPIQYRWCEIMLVNEYVSKLLGYIVPNNL